MKRNQFVFALLFAGIISTSVVSCDNNKRNNQASTLQTSNTETPMMVGNVKWETASEKENAKVNVPQTIQIGSPELVKYENISTPKAFSYACYSLSECLNNSKTFSFDFDNDGKNEDVVIIYSSDGLKVHGNSEKIGYVILDLGQSELEELEPEYIQVSAYDFDNDGVFEMLLSVGNGYMENFHVAYSFNPSAKEYYNKAGAFESQQDITLNGDEIEAPYGSQGLFESFRYSRGRIIEESTW